MKPIRMRDLSKRAAAQWSAIAQGAPELLDDLDMQRMPRAKPAKPEADAQARVVTYLRKHLPKGSVVFSIPNQSYSRNHAFAATRTGQLAGVPDLCVICPNPQKGQPLILFIEMKAPAGRLSTAQEHTQQQLRALGIPVFPRCTSVEEAVVWLRNHGVEI
jgi:hypothetical protein